MTQDDSQRIDQLFATVVSGDHRAFTALLQEQQAAAVEGGSQDGYDVDARHPVTQQTLLYTLVCAVPPSDPDHHGFVYCIRFLCEIMSASVGTVGDMQTGETALHAAARLGQQRIVSYFISRGTRVDGINVLQVRDRCGLTPLGSARAHKQAGCEALLEEAGKHQRNSEVKEGRRRQTVSTYGGNTPGLGSPTGSQAESASSLAYVEAAGVGGASSSPSSPVAATIAATLASLEAVVEQQISELESSYPSIFTVVSTAAPGRAEKVSTAAPAVWRHLHGNLPYTVQGGTYITPIILVARWEAASPPAFTSSFTTFINRKSLDGFSFSSQATLYMDPLTGRILPSPSDSCWQTSLATYVRLVPQRLFEHIPPLVDCRSVSAGMSTPLMLPYVVPSHCFPPLPLPTTGAHGSTTVLSGYDGAVCGYRTSSTKAHSRTSITESDLLPFTAARHRGGSAATHHLQLYTILRDLTTFLPCGASGVAGTADELLTFNTTTRVISGEMPLFKYVRRQRRLDESAHSMGSGSQISNRDVASGTAPGVWVVSRVGSRPVTIRFMGAEEAPRVSCSTCIDREEQQHQETFNANDVMMSPMDSETLRTRKGEPLLSSPRLWSAAVPSDPNQQERRPVLELLLAIRRELSHQLAVRRQSIRRQASSLSSASSAAYGDDGDDEDDEIPLCMVCMDKASNVVCHPCQHCACCDGCFRALQESWAAAGVRVGEGGAAAPGSYCLVCCEAVEATSSLNSRATRTSASCVCA